MPVITLTIVESENQLLSGIPKFVTMSTNVPTTIFYTFDETDPDTSSPVYVGGELAMPTNQTTVIFKVFATDGTDSSAIITRTFRPVITALRKSHDTVALGTTKDGIFPYTDPGPEPPYDYQTFGPSNLIVDSPGITNIPDGYDGTATGTAPGGTDEPLENYLIRFSETNWIGERGNGLGTVPTEITVTQSAPPPQSSNMNDRYFDARAMVIFQDSRETPFDPNLLQTNRQFFSFEDSNAEKIKDGILLHTTAFEGGAPTGSFVRAHHNPRENTTTYYYFDSQTLRWIISVEPATTTPGNQGLANILFPSRDPAARFVYRWYPFKGSRLI